MPNGITIPVNTAEREYALNEDIWQFCSLRVANIGSVQGTAYTNNFLNDFVVQVSVSSFGYDSAGEHENHVPHVAISDAPGHVIAEPHAHDEPNPHSAIENVLRLGEDIVENPLTYISTDEIGNNNVY